MFHGHQSASAGERHPKSHLGGDFFVRSPLSLAAQVGKGLQDFSGRSAGVSGPEGYTAVDCRKSDCLVATQQGDSLRVEFNDFLLGHFRGK